MNMQNLLLFIFLLCWVSVSLKKVPKMSSTKKRLIVDVDPGTDDALALIVLLYAEKQDLVIIEAIICSNGNTDVEHTCKNLVTLLELVNRTDIPVYKGVTNSILPPDLPLDHFFGKGGFGDLVHSKEPDLRIIRNETASAAMRKLVVDNPGEITLVCVAPLTVTALTMKLYNDFGPNIKDIFIMGGNYKAVGNMGETSEFNFYADPEAAFTVLNELKCPITIAPWEACIETNITLTQAWRFDVLGLKRSPFMDLLNRADESVFIGKSRDSLYYPCDAFLVTSMLYPKQAIIEENKYYATVELCGRKTRGQVVLDHISKTKPNVNMIINLDDKFIKTIFLKAAGAIM